MDYSLLVIEILYRLDQTEYYRLLYVDPLIRIGPYLIGILLGWFVFETKKTNYKISKVSQSIQITLYKVNSKQRICYLK